MADYTLMPIDGMETIWGGGWKRARASLGVNAFGMSVSDLPPGFDIVPPHDHTFDGQEELYLPLAGDGFLEIEGERIAIDTETLVRVGPQPIRRPIAGPSGLRLLAIGSIPGKPYKAFPNSMAGAPATPVPELPGVVAAKANEGAEPTHDYVAKKFDEIESIAGHFDGISLKPVRRNLGISAFGVNLMMIEAGANEYPEHDHEENGQEEVYIPLVGSAEIEIDGDERVSVGVGEMIRFAPTVKRKIWPGDAGLKALMIGGVPGAAYLTNK